MIDALLYSVRDGLRNAGYGYDARTCEIRADGMPPPRCGDVFVAVHPGSSQSTNDNCLMELFSFSLTLTMRVSNVPLDRVGDQLLAKKLSREIGFDTRAEQLRAFFHMAWGIIQDANQYLMNIDPNSGEPVYGFTEPARYRGMEIPVLVGGEHFGALPDAQDIGLKAELRFEGAKRMQPIALYF
jgi:hypothetical protein